MTDEDFEKQLKEDFKNIINAMQSKSGEDIVGCPVCSGRTTYAKFRQFHAIASESGRFVGNIEERQRIKKLIDDRIRVQKLNLNLAEISKDKGTVDLVTLHKLMMNELEHIKELLKEIRVESLDDKSLSPDDAHVSEMGMGLKQVRADKKRGGL